ncbi:MAG TPA: pseudouridine-5'-phosphate glycosidase [Pseudonocardia sp.]|jgi:pseudouridine-5'-phosphate glycosidase|nr:pseudouridine-5'-phosphate glycosidase [Pseudonocardia sp.]
MFDASPALPRLSPEVADAVSDNRPVVALESTLLAHGLPAPVNREVAGELETIVRSVGAVPATVAVLDGVARIGLSPAELDRVCAGGLAKLSRRDLAPAMTLRVDGATTVAATVTLAALAGIRVFATGGLGGVHREATLSWDVSPDLDALSDTPVITVCSGVKSILDVPATLERLETLSVPVLGYRTDRFPSFYLRDSGRECAWRVDEVHQLTELVTTHLALGGAGVVLANPVPAAAELDRELHDRVLSEGLALAAERGVHGNQVTPMLLEYFHEATAGASLDCNIALVRSNVELGAQVARALSEAGVRAGR